MVPALTGAKFYFIYIPLIYRENLAGLRTAGTVDKTSPLFCQHRTGEEQVAAGTALTAIAFTDKKLALNIFLSEMNQPETS
ncbi:MAG: hypothetical protein GXP52_08500 [Deltaproteobacteria bacterium]|nr:hypothetical protein [Deltaproteobacteria bacterium]